MFYRIALWGLLSQRSGRDTVVRFKNGAHIFLMAESATLGDVGKNEVGFGDELMRTSKTLLNQVVADRKAHFIEKPLLKGRS